MTKTRKISLVVLSLIMMVCCCTLLSACGEYKNVKAMTINNAPMSVAAFDPATNGSIADYKVEVLKSFSVTLTYADDTTETFTGLDELNKNKIYLENFIIAQKGTYEVIVYCGKVSTTFTMTVS